MKIKKTSKPELILLCICTLIFLALSAYCLIDATRLSISLKNWDAGQSSSREDICAKFWEHSYRGNKSWRFLLSDGSIAELSRNTDTAFDPESFELKSAEWIYAEPSHVLMNIRQDGEMLADGLYTRASLVRSIYGAWLLFAMSLPMAVFSPVYTVMYAKKYSEDRRGKHGNKA